MSAENNVLPLVGGLPFYRFVTALSGVPYIFDVRWNTRDAAWYFDMLNIDETPVVRSVKILIGQLARRSAHAFFQSNVFLCVDNSGTDIEATIDDLGTRVNVFWYTTAEIYG